MGANVALIFSGQYVRWVSNMRGALAPGVDAWAVSLKYLMGAVIASGGVLLGAYKYMQDKIIPHTPAAKEAKDFPRKKKVKMTMKESAKFLVSSPYIRDLALLVISYGMCINIVEVSWKAKLKVRTVSKFQMRKEVVVGSKQANSQASSHTVVHSSSLHSKHSPIPTSTLHSWVTSLRLRVLSLLL
jgi:ATP/ADP translocase